MDKFILSIPALVLSVQFVMAEGVGSAPAPYIQAEMIPQPVPIVSGQTVAASGGCSGCGPTVAASNARRPSLLGQLRIGCGCAMPVGCGNIHSTKTFLFGSCRQFFNPGHDCGPRAHLFGGCAGAGQWGCCGFPGYDPCSRGNSFLNR